MADVKWQYQKYVPAEEMRLSPDKTEDVTDAPPLQYTQEQEETIATVGTAAIGPRKLSLVAPQTTAPVVEPVVVSVVGFIWDVAPLDEGLKKARYK